MSRFPNYFFPMVGGLGILFGLAYGMPARDYADQKQHKAEEALAKAEEQAAKNVELQTQIAAIQDQAKAKIAELEARPTAAASLTDPVAERDGTYGIGRAAHAEEIAAWDVDVLPDGRGLPVGSGNAYDGEEIFADKCGACHGDFAEGVDNWPVLAGGFDTLADEDPVKTVGSYWPYLSTAYDYIYRSMPFGEAGTLTPDETYAIVAYILYSNDLIEDDFELTNENLAQFEMHNRDGFSLDDRETHEYAEWRAEPCMANCKEEVSVTMRSVFLVDTPPEGGSISQPNPATIDGLPSFSATGPAFIPEPTQKAENTTAAETTQVAAAAPAAADPAELIKAGEKVYRKCKSCHAVGDGAKNKSGPQLNGLLGRTFGSVEGFKYSNVFKDAFAEGRVWDEENLAEFLAKPKSYMSGTKMAFSGLKKEGDREAIIAYLGSFRD